MALDEKDKKDIQTIIDDGLAGAGEQFAKQARTAAETAMQDLTEKVDGLAGKQTAGEGLTADDVKKVVDEAVQAGFTVRDETTSKAAEESEAQKKIGDARKKFIEANASKIPSAYHQHIPFDTEDEDALKAGLEKAQEALQADAASGDYGIKAADIGASAPGQATDGGAVDLEKMSPTQKIAAGLTESGK